MNLHRPDRKLLGMRFLLDPIKLAERIRSWLGDGELSLLNLRYKPETSCLATYRWQHNDKTEIVHAKTFEPLDWTVRKRKLPAEAFLDEEFATAVFKFPFDSKLKGMEGFVRQPGPFLSRLLFDKHANRFVEGINILAYKPNRRFVAVAHCDGERQIVIKLHDKSTYRKALSTAKALQATSIQGVPERIGRSQKYRAVAYDWISGNSVQVCDLVDKPNHFLPLVFEYLDRLQRSTDPEHIKLPVRSPLIGLESISDYIRKTCDPLSELTNAMHDRLKELRPKDFVPRVVHGDFYHQQLIVQGAKLFALDFDHACIADETTDIANFAAHLKLESLQATGPENDFESMEHLIFDHIENSFCDSARRRFIWYYAFSLFRLATHPFRQCRQEWMTETESILKSVQALLEQLDQMEMSRVHQFGESSSQNQAAEDISDRIKSDPALSKIAECFEPSKYKKLLSQKNCDLRGLSGNFVCVDTKARRHKVGRRCMIELEFATARGKKILLGKASAKRFKKRALDTQKKLFRFYGFDYESSDRISVPKTRGFHRRWRMWFQDKINATSASQLLDNGELGSYSRQIAQAISKLHHCDFAPKTIHSIGDELNILETRLRTVGNCLPQYSPRIVEIVSGCHKLADSMGTLTERTIHRDFYQDQILFTEDRTFLVDLDLVATGPAEIDIGNFVAHLSEHALRTHGNADHWANIESQIINHWLELNPGSIRHNIDILKYISFARHISISQTIKDRNHMTPRIIRYCEQLLAQIERTQSKNYTELTIGDTQ